MACCCKSSAFCLAIRGQPNNNAEDADPEFEKRTSNFPSIFANDDKYNAHRITLEDWSNQCGVSERNAARKLENVRSARTDLYQILGLYFVFQGVILTAVAQANLLTCHNWILPFLLCLLTSFFAFGACLQKLKEIADFNGQLKTERELYKALNKSIEALKEQGITFDLVDGQPDLRPGYKEEELSGEGSFDRFYIAILRFCSMWIVSYTGALLFLLLVFSGITLFSVHQILCNSGAH